MEMKDNFRRKQSSRREVVVQLQFASEKAN